VGSGDDVARRSPILSVALARALLWRRSGGTLATLGVGHLHDSPVQGLLLGGLFLDHGFKHGHPILQRLQGL
jgi:hypothetical protein